MTEIHVVTQRNRRLYKDLFSAYFKKRHEIFVGERGWRDLHKPDGLDIDAFDDHRAIYLLAVDGEKLVGGQRLYPTVFPHMLSEVFPHIVARPMPQNDQTFEWSRYFVVRERRTGRTDCRLLAAVQRFCLEEGIECLTAVVEMWWLPRWQQAGFKVSPLGIPQIIEGQPTAAVVIDISEESLAAVVKLGGLRSSNLTKRGLGPTTLERHLHAV